MAGSHCRSPRSRGTLLPLISIPNCWKLLDCVLSEAGVSNCDYVAGDAYEVATLVPQRVDLVFLANAFHGVPDRLRLARAVREVLKPSGRFAIVNWHRRPREETTVLGEPRGPRTELRMSPDQTIVAVEPAGLKLLQSVD